MSTSSGNQSMERIVPLDLLRFLAAASVVFFHYGFRGTVGDMSRVLFPEFYWPARYGFWGVEFFFVISGFVIAASAYGRTAAEFIAARAGRIYPAFFVCVTVTALVIAFLGRAPYDISFLQWLTNVTFTAPLFGYELVDGVYWTLALELIFYSWVALFLGLGVFHKRINGIIVCWLIICMFNTLYLHSRPLKFLLVTEYGPYFASGILLQRIFSGIDNMETTVLFLLSIIIGFLHPIDFEATFPQLYGQVISVGVLCALHFSIYLVLCAALWKRHWFPPSNFLLVLGGLTYPLYLVHENVGFILLNRLAPSMGRWGALVTVINIVLLVSWLIYRFVEPPGRRLVMRLVKPLASQAIKYGRACAHSFQIFAFNRR